MIHLTTEDIKGCWVVEYLTVSTIQDYELEYYSTDPEAYSRDWSINIATLKEYVEHEEKRLQSIRDFLLENEDAVTITHIDKD